MRRLLFVVATLVLSLIALEAASALLLQIASGRFESPRSLSQSRDDLAATEGRSLRRGRSRPSDSSVVHPYLGFTLDPDRQGPRIDADKRHPISAWGFLDSRSPIRKRRADNLIVGIFGGSVAYWLSDRGIDPLLQELRAIPRFAGRQISVVRLALGSYKQPQQLMTLSYLLSMGAEFDLIINLDGFNEVALPPSSNIPNGTFPFYPRDWHQRVQDIPSRSELEAHGSIVYLRSRRLKAADRLEATPLRWSMTGNLIWWLSDRRLEGELEEQRLRLERIQRRKVRQERKEGRAGAESIDRYRQHGPRVKYPSLEARYSALADQWKASSLQMHRLSTANGAAYWHFLQPNQYLPGAKPMGKSERDLTISEASPYGSHVVAGYPTFIEVGRSLPSAGVAYHDLTQIFSQEQRALYEDDCCHLNDLGNQLLATAIGERIAADLRHRTGPLALSIETPRTSE